ncbi:GNAT family N-acetyltransferase [Streptomyces sp. NPDC032472]|uniref:GNAT family N-acetyltransferase n=1 Tax=Streptomyces sp. NPDC032472 TaxID=3155018 RepID=UPI0033D2ADAC
MNSMMVSRVSETQWQAVANGRIVGHGDAAQRSDGRLFVSIDVWQDEAFGPFATEMLADLQTPLHTLVDEADSDLRSRWEQAGFTLGRREGEYVLSTDPRENGLGAVPLPQGVTILPGAEADAGLLHALDRAIREEVEASVGWQTMPAEVVPRPAAMTAADPSKYTVAVRGGAYVGLARVAPVRRRARIGLVAVRAGQHRQGIGRALLAHALASLHRAGTASAWAEADESNTAAIALLKSIGARRTGSYVELVRH